MMKNIFESVTNRHLSRFSFLNPETDTRTAAADAIAKIPANNENYFVYSFDLKSCTMKKRMLYLAYDKCNNELFANEYRRRWYYFQREEIDDQYSKFLKADAETDTDKDAFRVVKERYEDAMNALDEFKNLKDATFNNAVSLLVSADRNAKIDEYESIKSEISSVVAELKLMDDVETEKRDYKNLKNAISKVTAHIWPNDGDAIFEKYCFKANNRLAENVFRVAYSGEDRDKDGNHIRKFAADGKVAREIVLACFHEMQDRTEERKNKKNDESKNESKNDGKKGGKKNKPAQTETSTATGEK